MLIFLVFGNIFVIRIKECMDFAVYNNKIHYTAYPIYSFMNYF
jgi:hypothetical protein